MSRYSVDNRQIDNVIGYIKDGQISIPEIQRPFVWDGAKIRDLVDSLYHGFPVGYLIVWQNPDVKDKNGNLSLGKKIMIDGQQRVTAIMTALVGMKVLDKDFRERTYAIAFNPFAKEGEPCFEVQSAAILANKKWIPDISVIFKPDFDSLTFVDEFCENNPEADRKAINKLINKIIAIKSVPIGIINLNSDLTIDEVTEIFIRINSQGKSLTQADFIMSTIAADEANGGNILRKALDYYCHLATNKVFLNQIDRDEDFKNSEYYKRISWQATYNDRIFTPSFDDVIRVAFMSQYYRAKLANLTDLLHGRNFETRAYESEIQADSFAKFTAGVKDAIDQYTFTQFSNELKSAGFVFPKMLRGRMAVNFAYTLFIRLRNTKEVDKLNVPHYVKQWYVMSVLTGRYAASPETQMEKDLRAIKEKGFVQYFDEVMANLGETYWTITLPQALATSSSTAPTFMVYLASQCKNSMDSFLNDGAKVRDLIETADIHHIFPRQYLIDSKLNNVTQYNQVANYVVLSKPVNIAIGKEAPNVYFKEIYEACMSGSESKYTTIRTIEALEKTCKGNCIPMELKDMDYTCYFDFLTKRRLLMAQAIKEYFYSL